MNGRGVVAIAILAAWGAGIAVFIQRENNRSTRDRLAEAAMRVAPGANYFLVEDGERHSGFASVTVDTIPEGLQITDYSVRDTGSGTTAGRRVERVVSHLSRGLWLRGVEVAPSGPGAGTAMAHVLDDSTLQVVVERGGRADTSHQRFSPPLLLPSLVPLAVALGERPEPGRRYGFDVFDPLLLRVRRLDARVQGESVFVVVDSAVFSNASQRWLGAHADTASAWHLVEAGPGGIDVWVDDLGREIASRAGTIRRRRTAYEVAFENWRGQPRDGTAVGSTPHSPTTAGPPGALHTRQPIDTLEVLLGGLDLARFATGSPHQQFRGDTAISVHARLGRARSEYWLPQSRSIRREFSRERQVAPWIEVDDPAIVAQAKRVRRRDGDPASVARRLVQWVADSVRLESTLSPPSAVAALRSRAGDVEHHATLFVALARASGIPARAVTGLHVSDTTVVSHVWAEVWLAQQWLPVDPSSGQFPADGGRIRLAECCIGARPELDRVIDRATVRILRTVNASTTSSR